MNKFLSLVTRILGELEFSQENKEKVAYDLNRLIMTKVVIALLDEAPENVQTEVEKLLSAGETLEVANILKSTFTTERFEEVSLHITRDVVHKYLSELFAKTHKENKEKLVASL
jgi:hypothetical protein